MTTDFRPIGPSPARPSLPADASPAVRPAPIKRPTAKTKLGGVAVVCAKCAKRQGLRPKEIRRLLRDAYRDLASAQAGKRRKLAILESGCLGPCPKRSVAVATGASLAEGRVLLLDPQAGVAGARAALLPEFGPNAGLAPRSAAAGAGEDPAGTP